MKSLLGYNERIVLYQAIDLVVEKIYLNVNGQLRMEEEKEVESLKTGSGFVTLTTSTTISVPNREKNVSSKLMHHLRAIKEAQAMKLVSISASAVLLLLPPCYCRTPRFHYHSLRQDAVSVTDGSTRL